VAAPLESVPNFSEGRDQAAIEAIGEALSAHARVLDVHSDPDHNRSVFTLVGDEPQLLDALVAAVARARDRIDLRRHEGVHPCVGAADVVPLVPVEAGDMDRAKRAAFSLAERVGDELGLPVFLYGQLTAERRGPAFFRRGGPTALQRRIDAGELRPEFGPPRLDPGAGAVLVGARLPLVAFNVDLRSEDVDVAKEIAAVVRESGGGFPGVRALGFELPSRGIVQVSMNIEDWQAAPLPDVVARIEAEARARGVEIAGTELVGLLPAGAARGAELLGIDESRVLETKMLE
jgi:glutamate formiminotransferase